LNELIINGFWEKHKSLDYLNKTADFQNSDSTLRKEALIVKEELKRLGLEGLVGGISFIIINVESDKQIQAVEEMLMYTGYEMFDAFEDISSRTFVLRCDNSADFLITTRKNEVNPFYKYNLHPKSRNLPNTRLETFVFECNDIKTYVSIQQVRGVNFLTKDITETENYLFIQTTPSSFTGYSIGFVEWKNRGVYRTLKSKTIENNIRKPDKLYLKNLKELDHAATRVHAAYRDAAIIEFMELTNYDFDFAIYVESLNSITNVARKSGENFAMVFTSGIGAYVSDEVSGPTEKFVNNYGARVHHLAFNTENIEDSFESLKGNGLRFLIDLVGSREEGLKQTFTIPSKTTLLVNECIYRYDGFDGFFTKSNVTQLTKATDNQ
jgi:4-hydroxyphenylpyruvate dioxygenase-like putative hemolysin